MNTENLNPCPLERKVGRRSGKEWLLLFRSWLLLFRSYIKNKRLNESYCFNIACNLTILYWIIYSIYVILG